MSLKKIKNFGLPNLNPAESLQQMVSAYTEYLTIAEQEKTKRRDIEAWEKEAITRINAQRDLVITYLDRSFDERAENFRSLFDVVDDALVSGDNEQLALALHSITEIAKSSPFKDLANLTSVRAALNDPNHVWEF
ncbi:hypothetical protein [Rivularia sp. UHCC 0363]|uniref:hypothetical protein n=1 Tax=Rivularia sp. UHCC 0363 TaxID=3110244 RepID=UPI002B1E9A76|nr:hypothetical protein [Rivularia sp. UHCC 0363]MEA5597071.1 hypothetical protein [Rivularia sp. UHCC 0363]